jgi:hypothetical protein
MQRCNFSTVKMLGNSNLGKYRLGLFCFDDYSWQLSTLLCSSRSATTLFMLSSKAQNTLVKLRLVLKDIIGYMLSLSLS